MVAIINPKPEYTVTDKGKKIYRLVGKSRNGYVVSLNVTKDEAMKYGEPKKVGSWLGLGYLRKGLED